MRNRQANLPIFDALLSAEALEAHIRDMTSVQVAGFSRPKSLRGLQRKLRRAFVAVTAHAQAGEDLLPAAEWVLDNYPFLEEALVGAQAARATSPRLPVLRGGQSRVLMLMREAVGHGEGAVDAQVIALCARAYLSLRSLRMRELWALPRAAAIALLEAAAEVAQSVADAQDDRIRAAHYAAAMLEGRTLRLAEQDAKNPVLVERVCARLREEEAPELLGLLDAQLAALEIDREKAVADAHRRHALMQVQVANCIKSLRSLEALRWPEVFEELSTVEVLLRGEAQGVYSAMDFASRDELRRQIERRARGHTCPEEQVARVCRALADASSGKEGHVGYYLTGPGQEALAARLPKERLCSKVLRWMRRRAKGLYMAGVWGAALAVTLFLCWWKGPVALLALPAALSLGARYVAALGRRVFPARPLLKLDYEEGIPRESATLVVVPALVTSPEQAARQVRALEVYHLANRGENLSFALLSDFADHSAASRPGDEQTLEAIQGEIQRLKGKYGNIFGALHRPRVWSSGQGRFMGRERKRGALEDLNALLLGEGREEDFCLKLLPDGWEDIRYVLTVDADTLLPPGSVAKLAGAAAHPLNRPDGQGGYGVIAPRMENLPQQGMTRLQRLLGGRLGLDSYGSASFEVYQDLCGEGSFSGKGIYDVRAFSQALKDKIPENAVLSHDLIEGIYAKAALASDVVLYDAQPKSPHAWLARMHRWARGDWQLLPFLFRNDLGSLDRWKIADNLRRSLTPAFVVAAMLLGGWEVAAIALLMHLGLPRSLRDFLGFLAKAALLPLEAKTQLDAAARALYRTFVSHRHMLDWTTAAQAEQAKTGSLWRLSMPCALCAVASFPLGAPFLAALWLPAAWWLRRLSLPGRRPPGLLPAQKEFLMDVAARTYSWFQRRATHEENHLPPDNVQYRPYRGAAHRTSPTNIGLCLAADVAARDLGLIDDKIMTLRIGLRIASIEKLETWQGHLYNWYDTQSLAPLHPRYVSSVDGGNFAACLWGVSAALREVGEEGLAQRCDALWERMDFSLLYAPSRKLFSIGFDQESGKLSASYYDLLASEARLLSFIAIAKGDVSHRHWAALGRPLTNAMGRPTLLSWSGTMFEYLMPRLFLQDEPGTLLDKTCKGAVAAQMDAAQGRPWGESESGYYAFDLDLNYQYKAFGVPALSMKGGIPGETVVAPYASQLALMAFPHAACENLRAMAAQGFLGEEGFVEAADYTPSRLPEGEDCAIVRSTMAHHQGMGLLAVEAALGGRTQRRFAELPAVKAARVLLLESAPEKYVPSRTRPVRLRGGKTYAKRAAARVAREGELHLISGAGTLMALLPDATGYLSHQGVMLTRFRSAQSGPWGVLFYLRDAATGKAVRIGAAETAARLEGGSASYAMSWENIDIRLSATVSPEDGSAVYRIEAVNRGDAPRDIQISAYLEPVLAHQRADAAHRAYMDLFLEARQPQENMLLIRRRRRSQEDSDRFMALVSGGGEAMGHRVSRAAFLGRLGDMDNPAGLGQDFTPLGEEYTAPIEPCAVSRQALRLEGGAGGAAFFALGYGQSEEELMDAMALYSGQEGFLRAFDIASTRARVELQYLGIAHKKIREIERAAYILTFPHKSGRHTGAAGGIALGQEGLWRLGISGDWPMVLVRVQNTDQCALAREAAAAGEYWYGRGLRCELVFLNDYGNDYLQPVRERLEEIARTATRGIACPGGAHLVNGTDLSPQERELLFHRAALVLDGAKGSFAQQLPPFIPPREEEKKPPAPVRPSLPLGDIPLQLDNGYGGFAQQGREYLIYRRPPAPWCNVIANPDFGTMVSDSGGGYTWQGNSRENKLTPWCNDPVREWSGEGISLRDEGTGSVFPPFARCRHGQGYSVFESGAEGIYSEAVVFVDRALPIKCTTLRLRNPGRDARRVSVSAFAHWTLGADRDDTAFLLRTGREGDLLWASNGHGTAFLAARGGSVQEALPCGADGDPVARLRVVVEIPPGQEAEIHILLGFAPDVAKALDMTARFHPGESLREARGMWDAFLGRIRVVAPDRGLAYLCNYWLPYQALSARVWGRTGFYQAGGAYGFRDQLQDAAMLAYYDPAILREQILRCAAHQFEEGDVQHWWHEPRRGVRTRIRDDLLFLPWAVAHYVRLTGDEGILREEVPFLRAPLLEEGQEDAYLVPEIGESASLMAHCLRAIGEASRFGERGLPLMGGGDWNDAMNRVGIQGRGESVWLGWFLCDVLARFAPLCDEPVRLSMEELRQRVVGAVEAHGWDGAWYRRAYYDDGTPMGTAGAACCEIDLIAQAWAALCGQGDPGRAQRGMAQAISRLYDTQADALRLLWPPFDGTGPEAGYIAGYVPGVRENGGQYTHGAAWAVLALCQLEQKEDALRLLLSLMPTWRDPKVYRVEPYVAVADIYAGQHAGRGGWSWYTGSAAWLWRAAVEGLGGLRPEEMQKARSGPLLVAVKGPLA